MIHTGKFRRMEIYHNTKGETPEAIKAKTGCTTILNGVLFNGDGSLCCDVRINGKWIANDQWTYYGLGWSGDGVPKTVHTNEAERYDNYLSCVEVSPTIKRGRTAIGFRGDSYVALCVSDVSGAMTISAVHAAMKARCDAYLILDGGGSSYLDCPSGKVDTSATRKKQNRTYLLIWEDVDGKETGKMKKICLDPGHGYAERANQSPDGKYFEYLFTFDLASRIKPILERCGFEVLLTKDTADETPSLTARAVKANEWGADLYASIHSNAAGSIGWSNGVTGLSVYTYAEGGERDVAAKALLNQARLAGIEIFGSALYHRAFTVLAKTTMPAYLVEYGFHTAENDVALLQSSAYRDKLAITTAKGICEYFKVPYIEVLEPDAGTIFRVQVGAFPTRAGAERLTVELESKGYKPFITEVKA